MAAALQLPGHQLDSLPPRKDTGGVDLRRDGPRRSSALAQLLEKLQVIVVWRRARPSRAIGGEVAVGMA